MSVDPKEKYTIAFCKFFDDDRFMRKMTRSPEGRYALAEIVAQWLTEKEVGLRIEFGDPEKFTRKLILACAKRGLLSPAGIAGHLDRMVEQQSAYEAGIQRHLSKDQKTQEKIKAADRPVAVRETALWLQGEDMSKNHDPALFAASCLRRACARHGFVKTSGLHLLLDEAANGNIYTEGGIISSRIPAQGKGSGRGA